MQKPFEAFGEVFFAICKSVNTPYALSMWLRWKYRAISTAIMPDPARYDDASTFRNDYLCYSWPSKAKLNLEGIDLKQKALESFTADEECNVLTNNRLYGYLESDLVNTDPLIKRVRSKIAKALGRLDVNRIMAGCRFGNGASATLKRVDARVDLKITTLPLSVSSHAFEMGKRLVEEDRNFINALMGHDVEGQFSWLPGIKLYQIVSYNVFDTVSKSLKTDRSIAKEPTLNGFLQQAVHLFLRERLQLLGVNLRDQSVNQWLAGIAHLFGLSTLDLKSASNSVTVALVLLLFPADWFELLNSLRSHWTEMPDGTLHENAMFSSMGNAFTFELESLIFWAILSATCGDDAVISVYGDDLICPRDNADEVIKNLEFFGFRLNRDKSFVSGRFFESCGKHFFDGCDVTPAYQKENPQESDITRIRAHNRLIRWALRAGSGNSLNRTVYNATELLRRNAEYKARRMVGPIGAESDFYFQVPYGRYVLLYGIPYCQGYVVKRSKSVTAQRGAYAYWLRLKAGARYPWEGTAYSETDTASDHPPIDIVPLELSAYEVEEKEWFVPGRVRVDLPLTRVDVSWEN